MSTLNHRDYPVKPTRRAPRPDAPFAEGLFVEPRKVHIPGEGWSWTGNPAIIARHVDPTPLRLSDEEQRILDELRGDWPPAEALDDEDTDPADWGAWSDEFVFEPDEADRRWAAETFNALAPAGLIAPELAEALASGRLTCA